MNVSAVREERGICHGLNAAQAAVVDDYHRRTRTPLPTQDVHDVIPFALARQRTHEAPDARRKERELVST